MRIALAQFNPIVGDITGNTNKILTLAQAGIAQGADVLVTPELALTGYNPEDLLLRESFYSTCSQALNELRELKGITMVVGHPARMGAKRFNAATVLRNGCCLGQYHKISLPNDTVFDECRYFNSGTEPLVFQQGNANVGVLICEDAWSSAPSAKTADAGANVVIVLNASPFHRNKVQSRHHVMRSNAIKTGLPFAYVNLIGGQDELVFDGASFAVNRKGEVVAQAAAYEEELLILEFDGSDLLPGAKAELPGPMESIYRTLVTGVRDYTRKNSFPGALLGLSGGIDSALTLAVAVDALGAEQVHAVMMPSHYTTEISLTDSREMAIRLGIKYEEIDIWKTYESFIQALSPSFNGLTEDSTEENLQARIRSTLLFALSNKNGKLVLSTSNKSEMATGYCTIYGDMAGGFAVLKDVAKTLVFELSHWRNLKDEVIPRRIIRKPPSAELRAGQVDQDTLPPYTVLDAILRRHVEENLSTEDIIAEGYAREDVDRVVRLLKASEYKRHQAPIGPRITHRGFGKDWRYPITNKYY